MFVDDKTSQPARYLHAPGEHQERMRHIAIAPNLVRSVDDLGTDYVSQPSLAIEARSAANRQSSKLRGRGMPQLQGACAPPP